MDLVSSKVGIFGLPFSFSQAQVILIPVPWDVTTSYGKGTSQGPQAIRKASEQVDLYDFETGNIFEAGIHMLPLPLHLRGLNRSHRAKAEKVMKLLARGKISPSEEKSLKKWQKEVNQASRKMNSWVETQTRKVLRDGKIPGLVGGDHSSPFGCIKAVLAEHPDAAILHVDAHADLRVAYQGFEFSHASIMWNVVTKLGVKTLVQVGIRDFCHEEMIFAQENSIKSFYDFQNKKRLLSGESWKDIVSEIVEHLPNKIYVSFDIDGLDPALC
ncbi:MAG: arginase family protein, partial [Bdellovibrio sp.]